MPIYRWICPLCDSAYILPRHSKHQYNHWRCYTCNRVFHDPREIMTMMWSHHFEAPLRNYLKTLSCHCRRYQISAQANWISPM